MNPAALCHRCGAPVQEGPGRRLCESCASNPKVQRARRKAAFSTRAHRVSVEAWRRGEEGRVTGAQLRAIWRRQRGRCTYCRRRLDDTGFDVDHMMPRSRGGTSAADNLQLLCPTCNRRKGSRTHVEYLREVKK